MKKILPLLFFAATLAGASADFRGGKILNAEISAATPSGLGTIDPILYPYLPEKKIYAAVTVTCHAGRTLSVFDYSLDLFGKSYPCIAIRENNGAFSTDVKRNYQSGTGKKYTLLFIMQESLFTGNTEKLYLKANFPPESRSQQEVVFRILGAAPFTAPGAIPAAGLMTDK